MVAAWSVDRLGRSLTGLLELLTELQCPQLAEAEFGDRG
jgi:hypothetical protein